MSRGKPHILRVIVTRIAITVIVVMGVMQFFAGQYVYRSARQQANEVLEQQIDDTLTESSRRKDVREIRVLRTLLSDERVTGGDEHSTNLLQTYCDTTMCCSIEVVDSSGVIVASSNADNIGFDLLHNKQTQSIAKLLVSDDRFWSTGIDSVPLYDAEPVTYVAEWSSDRTVCVMVATTKAQSEELDDGQLWLTCLFREIGDTGYLLLCTEDLSVKSAKDMELIGSTLELSHSVSVLADSGEMVSEQIRGVDAYVKVCRVRGGYLVAVYPKFEIQDTLWRVALSFVATGVVICLALIVLLSHQMRKHMVDNVIAIDESLSRITAGDLNERVDVRETVEFEQLSDGINTTVDKLEELIHKEATRYDEELMLARTIQHTSLPNVFPPYPDRSDFGLYACMDSAKEVGGDFYDFFMLAQDKLAIVVADVSDKGIPAAMFMMRAKTSVKALSVSGLPVDEVMNQVNEDLCTDNEAGMFVTVWVGFVDLRTGVVEYVHAGHTCPALIHDGQVSWVKKRRNFIVGGRPHITYERQTLQLTSGDALVLYSDGVTEAFDVDNQMYGSERFADALVACSAQADASDANAYCKDVCVGVRADVAAFAGAAEQSDDITLLCFKYN